MEAIELTEADREFFRKFGRQPKLSDTGLGHGFEIIEREFNDIQYELRMVIEAKTAQITALTFDKEKLEKKVLELEGKIAQYEVEKRNVPLTQKMKI